MAWTSDVVADLRYRVIEQFDESARSFSEKLADQLAGASQEVHLLAAEMLYVHLLALSNVTAEKKLENINGVGAIAPEPFEVPDKFVEPLGLGSINGGAGFNTNRYYLVEFLIEFAAHWSDLSEQDRSRLLDDPWAFKAMLVALPQRRANAQRNAVLFLLFPGSFEDISSNDHKKRIIAGFPAEAGDSTDLDRQLLAARRALSERFGPEFSWYSNEVRPLWDVAKSQRPGAPRPDDLERGYRGRVPGRRRASPVSAGHGRCDRDGQQRERVVVVCVTARKRDLAQRRAEPSVASFNRRNRVHRHRGRRPSWWGPSPNRASRLMCRSTRSLQKPTTSTSARPATLLRQWARCQRSSRPPSRRPQSATPRITRPSARKRSSTSKKHSESSSPGRQHTNRQAPPGNGRWIVRVKREDGTGAAEALEEAKTKVFWDINIPAGSPIDDVRAAIRLADPDASNNVVGNQAGNLHRFITRMQPGDLVLMPDKSDLYFGSVISDAVFDPLTKEWSRDVEWANADAPVDRADVSPALYSRLRTLLTVTEISELADELRSFVDSDDVKPPPPSSPEVQLQAIDNDTAQTWMLDREWLQEIVDMLSAKKQVIFYGPPGTGKTYLATKLANQLTANGGSYQMVQFHPSYSYEDFVEGFRPRVTDGHMTYELSPGPVKNLADAARQNPNDPYFLIIDEINRGNLAKIFGELYFLLEYRDESLILQYGNTTDDEFSLPKNLFVIGTMNTADRSIAMVDAAIRRRFYFVEFSPTEKPISGLLREWLKRERLDEDVALLLEALNERLDDTDYSIGPSYLMTEGVGQQRELERIWKHAIMPLLTEHFYGQPGAVERFELSVLQRALAARRSPPTVEADSPVSDGDVGGHDSST